MENNLNVLILPTVPSMTALERALAINLELYKITRPISEPDDVTKGLFMCLPNINESIDQAVIMGIRGYVINVSPDRDLQGLFSLFPDLSDEEKFGVSWFLSTRSYFYFEQILPQFTVLLNAVEMEQFIPKEDIEE
jgi:hypothetical protein